MSDALSSWYISGGLHSPTKGVGRELVKCVFLFGSKSEPCFTFPTLYAVSYNIEPCGRDIQLYYGWNLWRYVNSLAPGRFKKKIR